MIIANPIYDSVFKYLLEDAEIARELLGAILGEEIISLEARPQETTAEISSFSMNVLRLDFKAVVKMKSGETKKVLVELQKAKQLFDIMRFRRYLGENYSREDNTLKEPKISYGPPLAIVTIYFLGFKLEHILVPVLKVDKTYRDAITGKTLSKNVGEEFVELLTHESFIIQIPRLEIRLKTQLEEALQIFSQERVLKNVHELRIEDTLSSPLARKMANRLNRAVSSDELRRVMDFEDEIEHTFERELNKERLKAEKAIEAVEKREKAALNREEAERKAKEAALNREEAERKAKEEALRQIAELKQLLRDKN